MLTCRNRLTKAATWGSFSGLGPDVLVLGTAPRFHDRAADGPASTRGPSDDPEPTTATHGTRRPTDAPHTPIRCGMADAPDRPNRRRNYMLLYTASSDDLYDIYRHGLEHGAIQEPVTEATDTDARLKPNGRRSKPPSPTWSADRLAPRSAESASHPTWDALAASPSPRSPPIPAPDADTTAAVTTCPLTPQSHRSNSARSRHGPIAVTHPPAGDLRHRSARQHRAHRVQPLLDHRQRNQHHSRPPARRPPRRHRQATRRDTAGRQAPTDTRVSSTYRDRTDATILRCWTRLYSIKARLRRARSGPCPRSLRAGPGCRSKIGPGQRSGRRC